MAHNYFALDSNGSGAKRTNPTPDRKPQSKKQQRHFNAQASGHFHESNRASIYHNEHKIRQRDAAVFTELKTIGCPVEGPNIIYGVL